MPVSSPIAPPLWAPSSPPLIRTPPPDPSRRPVPVPQSLVVPNSRNPTTGAPVFRPDLPPGPLPPDSSAEQRPAANGVNPGHGQAGLLAAAAADLCLSRDPSPPISRILVAWEPTPLRGRVFTAAATLRSPASPGFSAYPDCELAVGFTSSVREPPTGVRARNHIFCIETLHNLARAIAFRSGNSVAVPKRASSSS
jgi:hypothetical protein